MMPEFTPSAIINLILICAALVFLSAEKAIVELFAFIKEAAGTSTAVNPQIIEKYSRVASAVLILRFVSVLVKVAIGLALALSFFKAFADIAQLALPDKTLGFAILISYCGLVAACSIISGDIRDALRTLFNPTSSS